jgi:methyl-accepting chemotaxis protein
MNHFLDRFRIGTKLSVSFISVAIILILTIGVSYAGMSSLYDNIHSLYSDHIVPIETLGQVGPALGKIQSSMLLYIQLPDENSGAAAATPVAQAPASQGETQLQCATCHKDKLTADHHLLYNQKADDVQRCTACHEDVVKNLQHGQSAKVSDSTPQPTSATMSQNCSACHPDETLVRQKAALDKSISENYVVVNQVMAQYKEMDLSLAEKTELANFSQAWQKHQGIVNDVIKQVKSGNKQDALHRVVGGDAVKSQQDVEASANQLISLSQGLANDSQKESAATFDSSKISLATAGLVGLLLAGSLGIAITRNIRNPLGVMVNEFENLRLGILSRGVQTEAKESILRRKDELGLAGQGIESTEAYLQDMAVSAQEIADGNLTIAVARRSDQDELGNAFIQMISNLNAMVSQVAQSSAQLSDESNSLMKSANRMEQTTESINATIEQVAAGMHEQVQSIAQTLAAVEEMAQSIRDVSRGAEQQSGAVRRASELTGRINSSIEQVAGNAREVANRSAEAAEAARTGGVTIEQTLKDMQSIKARVGLSAEKVEEMNARSSQIGAIVETIEDIASQTNMLALNAAIEAARAGEQGKGFAVVADEVRKLAERAGSSAKEITGLVKNIKMIVSEVVVAMQASAGEVETGARSANEAGQALMRILNAAEVVYKQAREVSQATSQVKQDSGELVSAIDLVSGVVQENTRTTENMFARSTEVNNAFRTLSQIGEQSRSAVDEMAGGTTEMSDRMRDMASAAESLRVTSEELQQAISQFRLAE